MVESHPGWPTPRSSQTMLGRTLRAKGSIFTALGCLSELLEGVRDPRSHLAVHVKPMRRVVALGHKAVAELHLVPETTNLEAMSDEGHAATSPENAANTVEVAVEPTCVGYSFCFGGRHRP